MDTLTLLQYIGPICGVLGFIISPGLTVIYPWLREKFNKDRKAKSDELLSRKFIQAGPVTVSDYLVELNEHFKFDWRPRVIRAKRRAKKLYKEIKRGSDK